MIDSLLVNNLDQSNESKEGNTNFKIIECEYLNNNRFNGIISYIKRRTKDVVNGKNDHLRLSAGSEIPRYPLSNLLLNNGNDIKKPYYSDVTSSEEDAYIEFDFVNRKINLTSYSIRKISKKANHCYPKTWKIIGSSDHQNWELIDMQENNSQLNGSKLCGHFKCEINNKYYRYIRYIQIGNWSNQRQYNYIGLTAIEFFGSIMIQNGM